MDAMPQKYNPDYLAHKSKQLKTTPQFDKAIKALVNTPPISNEDLMKRNKGK
jgi:hypothetical protein